MENRLSESQTYQLQRNSIIDLVGICDINPGRLAYGKTNIGYDAPTFTDIDEML